MTTRRGGAVATLAGLLGFACASAPVTPPPAIDPGRLTAAREAQPALTAEVELMEWRAREHAARGDLEGAERLARLARALLIAVERVPAPRVCVESAADAVEPPAEPPASDPIVARTAKKRRRRKPKPPPPPEPTETAPAAPEVSPVEQRMQALALALRRVGETRLDADGRVWVDGAQRALIDAQRALAAGAPERARQYLDRVTEALAAVGGEVPEGAPLGPTAAEDPLLALAHDLESAGLGPSRSGPWLSVGLPEARTPGNVNRRQRDRLQVVGRLLRVYGAARACVRASAELRSTDAEPAVQAIMRYLQSVEQLEAERFVPCPEAGPGAEVFRSPEGDPERRLFVGLSFAGRRSS